MAAVLSAAETPRYHEIISNYVDEVEKTLLKAARKATGRGPKATKLLKFNNPQNFYSHWERHFGDHRDSE